MTQILVCIPTVSGREQYLVNAIRSICDRTNADFNISLVHDAPSAGVGWNRCAARLPRYPETTHLFFFNDDAMVAWAWDIPLIEACAKDCVPAVRVEPAGGHIGYEDVDPQAPERVPAIPNKRDKMAYFYSDLPERQPTEDWTEVPHGNMPFCSVEQWHSIGEFPPFHFGTDCWFAERAALHGWPTVARLDSVVFNYNAQPGRSHGGWTEQDFLDFDGLVALPAYRSGALASDEPHPLRLTDEGLNLVRTWRHSR